MTDDDHMSETRDCGGDAAAYVLGALEPGEAAAFRSHLEDCVVCRDDVATFRQLVDDDLPASVPQVPVPRRLRRRVMSEVRADARRRASAAAGPSRSARAGVPAARLSLAAGAALAAVALAVGGAELLGTGGATAVKVIRAGVVGPGAAQLRLSGAHGELLVHGMPSPRSGHIYEVWLERGSASPQPTTALFGVTSAGAGSVDVPGNLHGVTKVLVTQEPAGGSQVPTSAPVIVARIS
jgi:anti-sigma-K factor RskA